jgi:HEAT repeat protein
VDQYRAGRTPDPASLKIIMQELLAELISGDDTRAERSIAALTALGTAVTPALLDLTRAADADTRWWAVRALAASPHTRTQDLLPLLGDPAAEVRAAAALAICDHPHECAVSSLVETLRDVDALVAGLAGNALVKIGSPAVASLLEVMKEAPAGVRIAALRTLAEICDHRAIPVLMKSLGEESALLQYWATEGLQRLGLDMVYMKP